MSFCSKLRSFWADILQSTSSPFLFSSCRCFRKSGSTEVSRANCCMSVSRGPRGRSAEDEGTQLRQGPLIYVWIWVESGLARGNTSPWLTRGQRHQRLHTVTIKLQTHPMSTEHSPLRLPNLQIHTTPSLLLKVPERRE